MEKLEALDRAIEECDKRLVLIGPSDWDLPTPCDEWNVRDLVYHIAFGSFFYAGLATGAKFGDLLKGLPWREDFDADPVAHCRQEATRIATVFRAPGGMTYVPDWPLRPESTGAEMIDFRTLDLVVHTWDLSRAIGVDETLPTALAEYGLLCATPDWTDKQRAAGGWRDETTSPIPANEPPLWRLLRITGREP
jgi:uncharacterized protein (TIGR03086 family)